MTDPQADHYGVLGLPPTASVEQVKAAYRRRALRHHPDKNPGSSEAEEFFKRCTEAYNVLSDEQRRERYDLERLRGATVTEIIDMLRDLVGKRRRRRTGRDLRVDLKLTLEDTVQPVDRRVSFVVEEPCGACEASGSASQGAASCPRCHGKGFRSEGLLAVPRICARCGGQGAIVVKPCTVCDGIGTVEVERSYGVSLPAGVRDGEVTIAERQGEPGIHGGPPGDLRIRVEVAAHPLLTVDGDDVRLELPISFADAALGQGVEVPTLDGFATMKIPAGTPSGRVFRLGSRGLPNRRGGRGNELVTVVLETPVGLGEVQRALIEQLRAACAPEMEPLRLRYKEGLQRLRDERRG